MTTLLELTAFPGDPFYTGPSLATGVGAYYDVALAGRGYVIDWESEQFRHESVPLIRQQSDQSQEPGEASLNPEDHWRRSQSSWHSGAGQTYLDLTTADEGVVSTRSRFRASQGIDPWTRGQISLLPDTTRTKTSANANVQVVTAGSRIYALDGNNLAYSTDGSAWSNTTAGGASLSSPTMIASDGFNVWAIDATDLYYTTRSTTTYQRWHGSAWANCVGVWYAKGRLFTAVAHRLYNNLAQGSAIPTAPGDALNDGTAQYATNTDFRWVSVAEGPNAIYAAGFSGDKSLIFRTQIKNDGTDLDALVVAGELPDGEIVRSVRGYLGALLIGTDKGVRYATLDVNGDIAALGNIITTSSAVRCFEPQDRFVWFGLTNYTGATTGLGRLDLRTFPTDLTPAWATDLLAVAQGNVTSVVTFANKRFFTVASSGVWSESTNKVASGTLYTGWFTYGLPNDKTVIQVDVRHKASAGTYLASLGVDETGTYTALGTTTSSLTTTAGGTTWASALTRGESFDLLLTLTRSATDTTSGPVLRRWTVKADPGATAQEKIIVPLVLHEQVARKDGQTIPLDVREVRREIEALRADRQVVSYQEAGQPSQPVIVEDFRWVPYGKRDANRGAFDGTMVVVLKTVSVS